MYRILLQFYSKFPFTTRMSFSIKNKFIENLNTQHFADGDEETTNEFEFTKRQEIYSAGLASYFSSFSFFLLSGALAWHNL